MALGHFLDPWVTCSRRGIFIRGNRSSIMKTMKIISLSAVIILQLWMSSAVSAIDCALCGKEYRCLYPTNNEKCEGFGVSLKVLPDKKVEIHLYSPVDDPKGRYVAVGFNKNKGMPGASVVECSAIGAAEKPSFKFSRNKDSGRSNVRIPGAEALESTHFTEIEIEHKDGVLHCKANVDFSGSGDVLEPLDLTAEYFLLASHGKTSETGLTRHEKKGLADAASVLAFASAENGETKDEKPAESGNDEAPKENEEGTEPESDGGSEEKESDAAAVQYSSLAVLIAMLFI